MYDSSVLSSNPDSEHAFNIPWKLIKKKKTEKYLSVKVSNSVEEYEGH